jgi:hypothetical protein
MANAFKKMAGYLQGFVDDEADFESCRDGPSSKKCARNNSVSTFASVPVQLQRPFANVM